MNTKDFIEVLDKKLFIVSNSRDFQTLYENLEFYLSFIYEKKYGKVFKKTLLSYKFDNDFKIFLFFASETFFYNSNTVDKKFIFWTSDILPKIEKYNLMQKKEGVEINFGSDGLEKMIEKVKRLHNFFIEILLKENDSKKEIVNFSDYYFCNVEGRLFNENKRVNQSKDKTIYEEIILKMIQYNIEGFSYVKYINILKNKYSLDQIRHSIAKKQNGIWRTFKLENKNFKGEKIIEFSKGKLTFRNKKV